jgi:hypothetical protein
VENIVNEILVKGKLLLEVTDLEIVLGASLREEDISSIIGNNT